MYISKSVARARYAAFCVFYRLYNFFLHISSLYCSSVMHINKDRHCVRHELLFSTKMSEYRVWNCVRSVCMMLIPTHTPNVIAIVIVIVIVVAVQPFVWCLHQEWLRLENLCQKNLSKKWIMVLPFDLLECRALILLHLSMEIVKLFIFLVHFFTTKNFLWLFFHSLLLIYCYRWLTLAT